MKNICPKIFDKMTINPYKMVDLQDKELLKKNIRTNINFYGKVNKIQKTIEQAKIEDEKDIIINTKLERGWGGSETEIIVYRKNGTVNRYKDYDQIFADGKRKEEYKRISETELKNYWDFLNDCIKNKRFEIKAGLLNITKKPIEKGSGSSEFIQVEDGTEYSIEIIQGKEFITYTSYAPETYIQNKYPGYEERQKLLDLISEIHNLGKNISESTKGKIDKL